MGYAIRPATVFDVPRVAAIERTAFGDPWSADAFAGLVANPAVWFAVLEYAPGADGAGAVAGGAMGYGVLGYVVAWFAADEAEIANVALSAAARGRGLGACLLDAALGEAVRRGAETVYLEVRESNAPARRLYASRSFAEVGRRRRYYRNPPEDALVMARALGPGAYAPGPAARKESDQRA